MSALPNKRLKLTGGDRSKGSGVLCANRHELSFNDGCARASRPQLQRDPLTRTQHGSRPMRATLQLDVATRSHGAGVRPLRALLVACFLALAPMLAFAQQPAPTPVPRDTSPAAQLQQMMGMFNQMGPMYEAMMKSMIEGDRKSVV